MMQFTEEQRNALIEDCKREISELEKGLTTWGEVWIPYLQSKINRQQIALAALTTEPVAYRWEGKQTGRICYDGIRPIGVFGQPLYAAPPVAPLRLPSEKSTDVDYSYYPLTKARHEGWNACLAEIKRLNATVPEEKHND